MNIWEELKRAAEANGAISHEAAILELLLVHEGYWKRVTLDHEALQDLAAGRHIVEGDAYAVHLLNMLRQFRKLHLTDEMLIRIKDLTSKELEQAREEYIRHARRRMLDFAEEREQ